MITTARFFGVVGAFAAPVVALALCGVAHAGGSAPNVVGQKYSDASGALSGAGFTPVISTVVGDQEPQANCIVTRQQDRLEPAVANSSGAPTSQTLVSLNCDETVATVTKPGNSLESPQGRAAAAAAAKAKASATATPKT